MYLDLCVAYSINDDIALYVQLRCSFLREDTIVVWLIILKRSLGLHLENK